MKKAQLNTRITVKTKKKAQKVAEKLGITLTDVVEQSLKNFASEKRITFQLASKGNRKTDKQRLLDAIETYKFSSNTKTNALDVQDSVRD